MWKAGHRPRPGRWPALQLVHRRPRRYPSSDIRYNAGDKRPGDEGRWFVPRNFMVGKLITPKIVTSVEVGVPIIDDYRVYDFKIELRAGFFF